MFSVFWAVTVGHFFCVGGEGGYKHSNSSSVSLEFYESDECVKAGKWLN